MLSQRRGVRGEVERAPPIERNLSDHFTDEIASEEASKPSAEFLAMVKRIEKIFKIVDEPGSGTAYIHTASLCLRRIDLH